MNMRYIKIIMRIYTCTQTNTHTCCHAHMHAHTVTQTHTVLDDHNVRHTCACTVTLKTAYIIRRCWSYTTSHFVFNKLLYKHKTKEIYANERNKIRLRRSTRTKLTCSRIQIMSIFREWYNSMNNHWYFQPNNTCRLG